MYLHLCIENRVFCEINRIATPKFCKKDVINSPTAHQSKKPSIV